MSNYKITPTGGTPFVIDVMSEGDARRVAAMESKRTGITHTIDVHEDCRPGQYLDTIYCDIPGRQGCPVYVYEYGGVR
jgi:hypothetical protein